MWPILKAFSFPAFTVFSFNVGGGLLVVAEGKVFGIPVEVLFWETGGDASQQDSLGKRAGIIEIG